MNIDWPSDFNVRTALLSDLSYVMELQRRNRESVGGLPRPAIQERIEKGTLALGILNDEPCGYLMFDQGGGVLRIPQACIQYDARRSAYGHALVGWVLARWQADEVRLRCAADVEANLFWQDLGFVCTAIVDGGVRRGRLLNCWTLSFAPRLLELETISPAAQLRVDSMYDDSGFFTQIPSGFADMGNLDKLAWANRRVTT